MGCATVTRPLRIRGLVSILVALVIGALAGCGGDEPATLRGLVRDQPLDASGITLPEIDPDTPDGPPRPFRVRAEPGEILLVYFGFTSCPDVCPTTLFDLRAAVSRLGDDADRVALAMVTVDPRRDTPATLVGYLASFSERFHALRPEDGEQLMRAERAFLASSAVTVDEDGEVEVAHTAVTYAVDDQGLVVVEWPFGTSVDTFEHDLAILLDRADVAREGSR